MLEQSIELLRGSVPKPKFSFKRKQPLVQPQTPLSEVKANPHVQKSQPVPIASNSLVFSSRSNEYLTTAAPLNYTEPSDVSIYNLDNCVVDFLGKTKNETPKISALHGRNLTNCVLYLPLIEGSVLLHDLKHCTVVLGCHQVCWFRVLLILSFNNFRSSECIRQRKLTCIYAFHLTLLSSIVKKYDSHDT